MAAHGGGKRRRMCYVLWKQGADAAGDAWRPERSTAGAGGAEAAEEGVLREGGAACGRRGVLCCMQELAPFKVPPPRLAALLRTGLGEVTVGSEACVPHVGLRVQVRWCMVG